MNNSISLRVASIVLVLWWGGCGDDGGMVDGGGMDSGPPVDAPMADAPVPDDTGGDDAGGGGDCMSYAMGFCAMYMTCDSELFLGAFENMDICVEAVAAGCEGGGVADVAPLDDPGACLSARTADCDAMFDPVVPDACVPPPGPRGESDNCSSDFQCSTTMRAADGMTVRMRCFGSPGDVACGMGRCAPPSAPLTSRNLCMTMNPNDSCNHWVDEQCVLTFADDMDGHTDEGVACQAIVRGASGEPCYPGTEMLCASGLECDTMTRRCMTALTRDQACDPARDLCDKRHALSCQMNADGVNVCLGPDYAPVGSQCGTFMEGGEMVTRLCSAYALCTGGPPTVCELRKRLDEGCTATPDNCFPGLACEGGTCQVPTIMCP